MSAVRFVSPFGNFVDDVAGVVRAYTQYCAVLYCNMRLQVPMGLVMFPLWRLKAGFRSAGG